MVARGTQAAPAPARDWPQIRAFKTLLRAHARLQEEHRRHLGERFDLVISEFDMIAALGNTSGLRMRDLAEKMITSPGNVTRVAQGLEKRGLVERKRADHSEREVIARLTAAGQEFFLRHFLEVASFTSGLIDSALTVAEQKQLATLLGKLCESPKQSPEKGGGKG